MAEWDPSHDGYASVYNSATASFELAPISRASYLDHGNVTTTKTIDVTDGARQMITLTSASCAITFSGTPSAGAVISCTLIIKKDNNATAREVTWANAPEWPNDTPPTVEGATANAETVIRVDTFSDGGRRGFPAVVFLP